jgi:hypothetical protein
VGDAILTTVLKEEDVSSNLFKGTVAIPDDFVKGKAEVSYGLGWHKKFSSLKIR